MRAAVFHQPGDIRIEDVPDPRIQDPTDAIVRITHTAICGSDLWFYRGQPLADGTLVPELMDDVLAGTLDPSPVFDMTVDLSGVPGGYAAMDRRQALKVLVKVGARR